MLSPVSVYFFSKSNELIFIKLTGGMGEGPGKILLDFDAELFFPLSLMCRIV